MRLLIIIPAFNEEKTIAAVLRRVVDVDLSPLGVQKQIIVVDDGSTDRTPAIVEAEFPLVRLLRGGRRQGKGGAVNRALEDAQADYVIIQDADLEYDPADYPRLLEPVVKGRARIVYGSRFLSKKYPVKMLAMNFLGNLIGTWLTNRLYGSRLTDLMTCYKLVPAGLMKDLHIRAKGFEICPEMTAKLLNRGERICEIPISYRGRTREEGKKIKFLDGFYIARALLKYARAKERRGEG